MASRKALSSYAAHSADYPEGVFVTSDRQFGRAWASTVGRRHGERRSGTLYQVRPEGPLGLDPDYAMGTPVSWYCSRAVVVRVAEVEVRMTESEAVRAGARYAFWSDGTPRYTPDGFLTFHSSHADGVTPDMLTQLGRWRDAYSDDANYELKFLVARARGEVPADATLDEFRTEMHAFVAAGGSLPSFGPLNAGSPGSEQRHGAS